MQCVPTRKTQINPEDVRRSAQYGPRMDDVFFGSCPGTASSVVEIPRILRLVVRSTEKIQEEFSETPSTRSEFSQGIPLEELYRLRSVSSDVEEDILPKDDEELNARSLSLSELEEKLHHHAMHDHKTNIGEQERKELATLLREEDVRDTRVQKPVRRDVRKRAIIPPTPKPRIRPRSEVQAAIIPSVHETVRPRSKPTVMREIIREKRQPVKKKRVRVVPQKRTKSLPPCKSPEEDLSFLVASPKKREYKRRRVPSMRSLRWPEAIRVASASAVAAGIITILGSFSSLPDTSSAITTLAGRGADHLRVGMSALLALDVTAGEQEFSAAEEQFRAAEEKLFESTTIVQRLLARVDPAARYTSGTSLLEAGKRLASLRKEMAAVTSLFIPTQHHDESLTGMLRLRLPAIMALSSGLKEVDHLLEDVRTDTLPEDVREEFSTLVSGVRTINGVAETYVDSHEVLLELLGGRVDRTYLVLFQNNREIRATGGFIGSFALVRVSEGVVENINVDTIYNPDGQLPDFIIPPQPLQKITDRWYTRDANWFAHFPHSARKVASLFERSGGPTVDGVLTMTPDVLERMLEVTGDIEMPEYDITVTPENVIDETQRLTTFEYDREKDNPKAFMADLLPEVLDRLANAKQGQNTHVMQVLGEALEEKDILIWFRNNDAQELVLRLGWGGAIADAGSSDYLMRVESNIGGHKTDHLIETSVKYDVSIESDGSATATLVTTRHHTGSKQARPGVNPDEDWMTKPNVIFERVLVPRGSQLLEIRGFTDEASVPTPFKNTADYRVYKNDEDVAVISETTRIHDSGTRIMEEAGKTVFGNWIVTKPGETTVTIYRYRLPMQFETRTLGGMPFSYRLMRQHQPGHKPVEFISTVRLPPGFTIAYAGPEESAVTDRRTATFTGTRSRDMIVGIVAER